MTTSNDGPGNAFRPEEMDLSQLSMEQLRELKDTIVARASDRVGPEGFNPMMMATTTGSMFNTSDWVVNPADWLINVIRTIYVLINVATRRIGLAIASSGFALAASQLYTSEAGAQYAGVTLVMSVVFAVGMVVDMVRSPESISRG